MAVVAITRQAGSGGDSLGEALAGQSGYAYVGKKQIFQELEQQGSKWLDWGRTMDEHCPTLWEHYDPSFSGFVSLVEASIFSWALRGNAVLMGRGAHWLLRDIPHVLRILVIAPLEERIARVSEREHVNRETAARLVEFSDHERSCYIHAVYRRNWIDPQDYDAVFDTGRLSAEEVLTMLRNEIPGCDRKMCPGGRERLERLSLAARVKAAIATDLRFFVPTLEVIHDGTAVVVRGIVHSVKEHALVEETARTAAAPAAVRCELHYRVR